MVDKLTDKNPAAVELGRLGGLNGGKARALALSPDRRSEIARNAARKRWQGQNGILAKQKKEQIKLTTKVNPTKYALSTTGVDVEIIYPEMALNYLENNSAGRRLSPQTVKRYADEMLAGAWRINGEAIKFGEDGSLLDGQHRLRACVRAGIPFATYVVRNVSKAAFDSLDTGKKRSASDLLDIMHVTNAAQVARAARLLFYWEKNQWNHLYMPQTDIRKLLDRHPGIVDSVAAIIKLSKYHGRIIPTPISAFGHYMFGQVSAGRRDEFFERLYEGTALSSTSPIYMLRQRFIKASTMRQYLREYPQVVLMVKAWNQFYTGTSTSFLRFSHNSEMPNIVGMEAGCQQ